VAATMLAEISTRALLAGSGSRSDSADSEIGSRRRAWLRRASGAGPGPTRAARSAPAARPPGRAVRVVIVSVVEAAESAAHLGNVAQTARQAWAAG